MTLPHPGHGIDCRCDQCVVARCESPPDKVDISIHAIGDDEPLIKKSEASQYQSTRCIFVGVDARLVTEYERARTELDRAYMALRTEHDRAVDEWCKANPDKFTIGGWITSCY